MSERSPKQYAQALFESAHDVRLKNDVTAVTKKFVALLSMRGDMHKKNKIIEELTRLRDEEEGIVAASIVSASKLTKEKEHTLQKQLAKNLQAKKVRLTTTVNPRVGAGIRIQIGWGMIDNTVAGRAERLKGALQ